MPTSTSPRPISDRLEFVDALRGFALFGVFAANLFIFSGYVYLNDERRAALTATWLDRAARFAELVLIENKFMGLFAMLFGVSFWLFSTRVEARGAGATPLFYRRIGWLFALGALHGWLLWCWDILRFYALWGALLPLFRRVRPKLVAGVALGAAVLVPALVSGLRAAAGIHDVDGAAMDAEALRAFSIGGVAEALRANWRYDWYLTLSTGQIGYQVAVFGRLLVGLLAARLPLFDDLPGRRPAIRRLLALAAPLGIVANVLVAGDFLAPMAESGGVGAFAADAIEETGYLALSLAYAAGLALLYLSRGGGAVRVLAPLGRMALTFYLLQTLFGLWLFYGCLPGPHAMAKIGPAGLLAIVAVGYPLQVWAAAAWLRRVRFGPAEWAWRSLTYAARQPFHAAPR